MNIVFLNGNPVSDPFDNAVRALTHSMEAEGHVVSTWMLKDMKIPRCTGCFGCWVKTPGRCVSIDASREISSAVIKSDLTVFASPILMGFTSALLKNVTDKLIQNLHPYMEFDQKELHHRRRYEKYPKWGLFLGLNQDTDAEDLEIVKQIYRRAALNFKSTLVFACTDDQPVEEVLHEVIAH